MSLTNRLWLIISLGTAILALVLLAAGISQLDMDPGALFEQATRDELRALLVGQMGIFRDIAVVLLILSPLALFLLPRTKGPGKPKLSKPTPKSALVMVIQAIMWAIAMIIIRRRLSESGLGLIPQTTTEAGGLLGFDQLQGAVLQIPEWVSFSFSLALIAILVLVLWGLWRRRRQSQNPLDIVAQEARFALDELNAGGDLRNVILRCYYDMSRALSYQRGIRRNDAMTPREFEYRLAQMGLPPEPVAQLTRLFESVRYGGKDPGGQAESQAVDCLETILKASAETAS